MLDLGDTLVHNGAILPHVPEALESFRGMRTANGQPLEMCLVSDFTMPTAPVTPDKIGEIFEEYLELLRQFGLLEYFEPVERRITLSTHAGINKPDRRVFEKAIERLKVDAALTECLFITENEAHIQACGILGMDTLRFGFGGGFMDWAEAPSLVKPKLAGSPT